MISIVAISAIADVNCKSDAGWSIHFNSEAQPKYTEAYEVMITGEKSVVGGKEFLTRFFQHDPLPC